MLENIPLKYLWILVGLAIMSMELFMPGFILVFFGLGAVVVGVLLLFMPLGVNTQLVLYPLISVVLLVTFRRYAQGYFVGRVANTNPTGAPVGEHAGESAIVTEDIIPNSPQGKVEFHGTSWSADSDVEIKKGTRVTIVDRRNLTLRVKL